VFATGTISKNTRIIHYAGEKISNQESLRRERRYIRKGHIWCFKLTNRTVIDAGVGRQHRPVHQPRVPSELLRGHQEGHHLDSRVAHDPQGRGAHVPLQHRWRGADHVPVRPRMPDPVVTRPAARPGAVFYLHGFASSAASTKAGYFADRLRAHGVRTPVS
jgi:hypothetical protein